VEIEIQIGHFGPLAEIQRIEPGTLMPAHPVGVDQSQNAGLLEILGARSCLLARRLSSQRLEMCRDGAVTGVIVGALEQTAEGVAPVVGHRFGIVQILFVELFDECSVEAGQVRCPVFSV